jgi:hypothetical protein
MSSKIAHKPTIYLAAALLTGWIVIGCDSTPPRPHRTAIIPKDYDPIVGVPDQYHFLYSGWIERDKVEGIWKSLPYTKIELERTTCLGSCPSYIVTLNADGTAVYNGRDYATREGRFQGEVEPWDYGKICWMLDKFKILEGPPHYHANWTDAPTTIIRVTYRETNETIEISDYGSQGPIELWALFNAIDAVADRIEWKPKEK